MLEITFDLTIEYLHSQLSSFKSRDWKKSRNFYFLFIYDNTQKNLIEL